MKQTPDVFPNEKCLGCGKQRLIPAQLTQATLHSLALRSRAGQPRATLNKMARGAVEMICRA